MAGRNVPRRAVSSSHGGAGAVAILSEPDNSDAAPERRGAFQPNCLCRCMALKLLHMQNDSSL